MKPVDFEMSYVSTIRGITASVRDESVVYYGMIQRIPGRMFVTDTAKAVGQSFEEMMMAIPQVEGRLTDGVVERFEIRDMNNSDLLVMIRVPCARRMEEV